MPLSEDDRRELAAIAAQLADEDPQFVREFTARPRHGRPTSAGRRERSAILLVLALLAGVTLLMLAVAGAPALPVVLGLVVVAAALVTAVVGFLL